ncbi:MAG TPA: tryptophan synthase subunit beta [Cycloclasticus sp.]|nr:tryptophan synthase subunit beta [Cycloclasticus sp.]HIL93105.1 tryptophan synthase subunit beta [Cycloclasticus sp.]
MPDERGYFGEYGGQIIPPDLVVIMDEIKDAYLEISQTKVFQDELNDLYANYVGRPSPIYYAKRLSEKLGGAKIYLKREDLNHTGAHKINHCLGEALLAKHMGKTKVLAETGAGQHGVALATACALVGLDCEIHMGAVDIAKEHPNVTKMKILGCTLVEVTRGTQTLKDAVDSAFEEYLKDPVNFIYAIGSVVGPHPFPMMVRDFQSIVGKESREQLLEQQGKLPDVITACVGGGSNAIGMFTGFLNDDAVKLVGVEPAGRGLDTDDHAATMSKGVKGSLHGFECYNLQDENGEALPVYSIASGLDYPGVGPQHCLLKDLGRVDYVAVDDDECVDAFMTLSRVEGIIPALESAHAVAYAMKIAGDMSPEQSILVNLSGRGDKDVDFIADKLGL